MAHPSGSACAQPAGKAAASRGSSRWGRRQNVLAEEPTAAVGCSWLFSWAATVLLGQLCQHYLHSWLVCSSWYSNSASRALGCCGQSRSFQDNQRVYAPDSRYRLLVAIHGDGQQCSVQHCCLQGTPCGLLPPAAMWCVGQYLTRHGNSKGSEVPHAVQITLQWGVLLGVVSTSLSLVFFPPHAPSSAQASSNIVCAALWMTPC